MKKTSLFIILIFMSAILISCADKDQTADEIINYYNEEWIPINNFIKDNTRKHINEFIKLDSQNDKIEASELIETEIIPAIEELILQIESVDAKNKKTKKMNNLQLEAERFALEGFKNIIKYYEGEMTESELAIDNQKLDSMYEDVIDYQNKVFEEYGLERSDEEIGDFNKLIKAE